MTSESGSRAAPHGRRAATMADVAAAAGVSLQTVSRAFNPGAVIRPATRDRIVAAAARLGYRRNLAARALATRRSGLIGVVVSALDHFGPATSITGIAEAAQRAGYAVVLAALPDPLPTGPDAQVAVHAAIEQLCEQGVEAILVINRHRIAVDAASRHLDPVPVVAVAADPGKVDPCVAIDQRAGGQLAARHVLERGHTAVALVGGPTDWLEAQQRRAGWRAELRRSGVTPVAELTGDWTAGSGHALGADVLACGATAALVANDQMALGLMLAVHQSGRRVPDDLAVVGFDDRPDSAFYVPPLTTVRQDLAALGAHAIEVVRHLVDDQPAPTSLVLQPRLVVRESS
jgi:DNA-binding LacI/PurR family transcriptional regulator